MSDFFAVGHEAFAPVNSLAVVVNPTAALIVIGLCQKARPPYVSNYVSENSGA